MQKIDLGIALCHFALAAKESAINICFSVSDPGIGSGIGETAKRMQEIVGASAVVKEGTRLGGTVSEADLA